MFSPSQFRVDDAAQIAAFVETRRFATLVAAGPDGPVAAYAPLVLRRDGAGCVTRLVGHLARGNPLADIAKARGSVRALAIFHGADAYVTPSWYASKREHGRVVPTWNYVAAEAAGDLTAFEDVSALLGLIEELTDREETPRADRWRVSDAPADYLDKMINAITGIELAVKTLEAKRKLSQNRSEPDRAGVREGLLGSAEPRALMLAHEMLDEEARKP